MDHEITQGRWVKAQAKSKLTDGRPLLQAVMIDPWRLVYYLKQSSALLTFEAEPTGNLRSETYNSLIRRA